MKRSIVVVAMVPLLVLAIPGLGAPIGSWTQTVDTSIPASWSFQWSIGYMNWSTFQVDGLLFGDLTFTSADAGKTFTATASAYPATWGTMVAKLTDGTNDWPGYHFVAGGAGGDGSNPESLLFYGYRNPPNPGDPVDLAGNTITAINLTFDSITVRPGGSEGFLTVQYTVDVIPEPATLALLALGGAAAVVRRRRGK